MKKSEVFSCEKCGLMFLEAPPAEDHEEKCLELMVGQRVKFGYKLLSFEGRITALHTPALVGSKATVDLETEEEIDDPDPPLSDGKHVWVHWDNVLKVLSA